MKKLMEKHRKFMKGNAGFSLVELIIVIAIMAALVAILAPQYIKYVEKSRKQADETTADQIYQAAQVAAVEPSTSGTDFTITWTGGASGTLAVSTDAAADLILPALGLTEGSTANTASLKSKYTTGTLSYSIAYDAEATGNKFTISGAWWDTTD